MEGRMWKENKEMKIELKKMNNKTDKHGSKEEYKKKLYMFVLIVFELFVYKTKTKNKEQKRRK